MKKIRSLSRCKGECLVEFFYKVAVMLQTTYPIFGAYFTNKVTAFCGVESHFVQRQIHVIYHCS